MEGLLDGDVGVDGWLRIRVSSVQHTYIRFNSHCQV
jgi:hypothetical protein